MDQKDVYTAHAMKQLQFIRGQQMPTRPQPPTASDGLSPPEYPSTLPYQQNPQFISQSQMAPRPMMPLSMNPQTMSQIPGSMVSLNFKLATIL